jgi:hypothetical protein
MKAWLTHCVLGLGLVGTGLTASAAGAEEPTTLALGRFEVTPFMGYRVGGHFDADGPDNDADIGDSPAFGVALGLRPDPSRLFEVFYGRQSTEIASSAALPEVDLDIDQLQFRMTGSFDGVTSRLSPYALGSVGVTRFSLDAPDANDETRFSIAAGGGLYIPLHQRFDLRLEARVDLIFMSSSSSIFCSSNATAGTCAFTGSGSLLVQYEFLAGATFTF